MMNNQTSATDLLSADLGENYLRLQQLYNTCSDMIFLERRFGQHVRGLLLYFEGLTDEERLNEIIQQIASLENKQDDRVDQERAILNGIARFRYQGVNTFSGLDKQVSCGHPVLLTP